MPCCARSKLISRRGGAAGGRPLAAPTAACSVASLLILQVLKRSLSDRRAGFDQPEEDRLILGSFPYAIQPVTHHSDCRQPATKRSAPASSSRQSWAMVA